MIKIEYLVERGGGYYWTPSPKLRKAGWPAEPLGRDRATAIARALDINDQVARWKAGAIAGAARKADAKAAGRRSVDDLIADYKQSRHWTDLAPATRRGYDQCLQRLAAWFGDKPPAAITPPIVEKIYVAMHARTPAFANATFRVLRLLLSHAERTGDIPKGSNPCARMKLRGTPPSGRRWSEAAIAAFVDAADALDRHSVGTAVWVNAWTGQRQGDILAMTRGDYRGGELRICQSKTGAEAPIPVAMLPHVAARLDAALDRNGAAKVVRLGDAAADRPIIVSETTGRAYKADNFRHVFAEIRTAATETAAAAGDHDLAADIAAVEFLHLRHTAATRLAEHGATIPEIAAITGHSETAATQILERYLVRTTALARSAFARLKAASKNPR